MKKRYIATVAFASFLFLFGCSKTEENQKAELLEAIAEFNIAFQNADVPTLESMITENYIHTNGTSKAIQKEDWLNYLMKRRQQISTGSITPKSYSMDEMMVHFYGNTALVTAKIESQTEIQDSLHVNAYRITNVWIKEKDEWKRAGFHDGKIQ